MIHGLPAVLVYDVWLDGKNMIRRVTSELSKVKVVATMMPDPNAAAIKPPPASQTVSRTAGT